ncbi:MAG TPA: Asp-tRNA(Asn)/Glu-tRNA(Gln) amidotransferase subunit GatA [Patescibacteria group bacterium]|nr:Asp-tRNA(Asn)/Glu-tRNA(Gln) amidotransferase subunit GatA [Patescibacteria group bacterium]
MNLRDLTITEAKMGLKEKQFSSVELTRAALEQIKLNDPKLNAFITVTEKEALEQAARADELLADNVDQPLLGIPVALKDMFVTKGIRTTAASNVLSDYIPQYDGTVVKKIKDAGAIVVGKTNCDAWAHGSSGENSDFGPAKNPYNTDYVPGGSSSGSPISVATGMSLAATGTDTGGSIRLPASFCNVVGLKPTYGRVSRYGIIAMASSLDSIGHFTKTVEDNALFLNVTAGRDPMDATTPPVAVPNYLSNINKGVKGIKIGVPKEYFIEGLDPKVHKATQNALDVLKKLGAEIVEISLPNAKSAIAVYYIIQTAEVSSNLARYDGIRFGNDRSSFGDEAKRRIMLGTYVLSAGYYDAYYKKAMQVRTLIKQDFEKVFEKVDVLLSPASPTPPWKIGEKTADPLKMYLSDIFTVTANIAGIPGLSVPAEFVNGLPTGIQILGPHFSEEKLYQVGHAFEKETEFWKTKPNL